MQKNLERKIYSRILQKKLVPEEQVKSPELKIDHSLKMFFFFLKFLKSWYMILKPFFTKYF